MASNCRSRRAKTIIELYQERDQEEWYWRWLATLSPSLILLGFMVFPASFTTTINTVASSGTLSVVAVVLLALGYSLSVALWFICRSWLFQLDVIFIPCLLSCFLGALNTAIALSIHPASPTNWSTSSVAALVLALTSTLIYTILSLFTHRKIFRVRRGNSPHSRKSKRLSSPETLTLLPEEEIQRQHLLRLLSQKESPRLSPSPGQSTFRIDIPDNARAARNLPPPNNLETSGAAVADEPSISYLAAPSATYESAQARGRSSYSATREQQQPPSSRRGHFHEDSANARQAALQAARQRERTRSRESAANNNLFRDPSPAGPPVIINSQHAFGADLTGIPLEDRHPLERGEADRDFVAGRGSKDKQEFERIRTEDEAVWRPEDHVREGDDGFGDEEHGRAYSWQEEDAGPVFEIVEGTVEVDLGKVKRMQAGNGWGGNPARPEWGGTQAQEAAKREIISPLSASTSGQGPGIGELITPGEGTGHGNTGQSWNKTPSEYVRGPVKELDGEWTERRELDGNPF